MARIQCGYMGISLEAEGSEEFCNKQGENITNLAKWVYEKPDGDSDYIPEEIKQKILENAAALEKRDSAPVTVEPGIQWDVVAIYDNAGIPSIMHRFQRVTNKELFGGSDKINPAFIIGGEVYDEIYISVYENTMINGKPYSLPFMAPATNIKLEDFAEACFSKGEGWHCVTGPEWGLLANISLKNGTLPHGNTDYGKYHADKSETGTMAPGSNCKTLTGSGPATWTHDHTPEGVHDLCGNILEFCRGVRIKNGTLQKAPNNDAALPETDLSLEGDAWEAIKDDYDQPIYVNVNNGITFDTERGHASYEVAEWKDVEMECDSETLKELALYAGEPNAICAVDTREGEFILFRGGYWSHAGNAGVFYSHLRYGREYVGARLGGRSAYFKKHGTPVPETQKVER